jgi:gliding motility-associated-like protein
MKLLKAQLILVLTFISIAGWTQTPNNCNEYTTAGTSGSSYNAGPNAGCNGNVGGQVNGTAAWTGTGCAGTLVSTVVGPAVTCLTLAYTAVNTNDFGTMTTNTGGTLTITAVNADVVGNVVGPFTCIGSYGDVSVTICSTVPFTSVTLTNSGCTSGWVINCATQTGCGGGGGGNAGADDLTTVTCGGTTDLNSLVTGSAGGTWEETTIPASGAFNTGTGVFDANAAAVGIYTFDYIVSGGCAGGDTAQFQIEVSPLGDAAWTVPAPPCANDPDIDLNTLFTGTAGGTWSGTGVTGSMFDPSSGSQNITYTAGTAPCDDIVTQMFTVTPASDPTWATPGTICETGGVINLDLLLSGTGGGTWSGSGVTGTNFDPTGLSAAISVTYTVGTAPCLGVMTDDITVNPDVDPAWTAPANLCDVSPLVDLNALITGTTGGTWSGTGVTGSDFDPAAGSQNVTYTVGLAPCIETSTLLIDVVATPDPTWTTISLCSSAAPFDLDAQITGDAGGTWSGTGVTGTMFDPSGGSQDVTYTVNFGVCSDNLMQTITVGQPQVDVTVTSVSCFGLIDGTADATVTGGSGNYTYSWSPGGQTTASITGLSAGDYTVTVTDVTYGCSDDVTITIIEPTEIIGAMTAANGCQPGLGSGSVQATGGSGGFTYVWNSSASTFSTADDLDSSMHTVIVTDANGCTFTDSIFVHIFDSPIISLTPDTLIAYNYSIVLFASGADQYSWDPIYALDCDDCPYPIAGPLVSTEYCVTGIDTNGCIGSNCVQVDVEIICGDIFVPSGFSPNADDNNDELCVYSDCMQDMDFTIYNRWGEIVFESGELDFCWDGMWKGKELNPAVYVYILSGQLINGDLVQQKGNITLIR